MMLPRSVPAMDPQLHGQFVECLLVVATRLLRHELSRCAHPHLTTSAASPWPLSLTGGPGEQVAGVTEVAESELQAFVDAIAAGDEASLPGMTAAPGASLLGRGGYAAVYRATLRATGAAGAAEEAVALKVAAPAAPWEFAAVRALVSRVPHRYSSLFMPARCIFLSHAPAGGPRAGGAQRVALAPKAPAEPASALSVLAMPLGTHGTLLDLINAHKTSGRELGPSLVMYLSLQLVLVCSVHPTLPCTACTHSERLCACLLEPISCIAEPLRCNCRRRGPE